MYDGSVPTSRVAAIGLWVGAFALLLLAWVVFVLGDHDLAVMVGFTTCPVIGAAAVASIRCYAIRTTALIRALHGLELGEAAIEAACREQLHSVR